MEGSVARHTRRAGPRVSVIIATYCPGESLTRVVDSLAAQTMPVDQFEVVFVDDGSPDDTYARLQTLAAERENVRAFRIDSSGWPSRPRNVGLEAARGEYVLFMDHDDALYPDGLRRAYEYARETDADLLSLKESKTDDRWWCVASVADGNLPNVLGAQGIRRIIPMVPHKLYRRRLLLDRGIRFPEGPRMLWEDQYVNLAAYAHADVVAVLADTPVYLWHGSESNTSRTFDPARADYWTRLEDVLRFTVETLDASGLHDDRVRVLAHQTQIRLIDTMIRLLSDEANDSVEPTSQRWQLARRDESPASRAFREARRLIRRYVPQDVEAGLSPKHRLQAVLLRRGRRRELLELHEWTAGIGVHVSTSDLAWEGGSLTAEVTAEWRSAAGALVGVVDGQPRLDVPASVARRVPTDLLAVGADSLAEPGIAAIVRGRRTSVSWPVPVEHLGTELVPVDDDSHSRVVRTSGRLRLDLRALAGGSPLPEDVWDVHLALTWWGVTRRQALPYRGPPRPAMLDGRPIPVYANTRHALSLDLTQELRTLVLDARPQLGPAPTGLTNLHVDGDGVLRQLNLCAVSEDDPPPDVGPPLTRQRPLQGQVESTPQGPVLSAGFEGGPGRYRIHAARRDTLHPSRYWVRVDRGGRMSWEEPRS